MARTMLDEYETPKHFWAEAVETACHATNHLYLHKLLGKTAYKLLTGYGSNSHTYRVYNNFTRKVEETVDVKFDESNGLQVEQLPDRKSVV